MLWKLSPCLLARCFVVMFPRNFFFSILLKLFYSDCANGDVRGLCSEGSYIESEVLINLEHA